MSRKLMLELKVNKKCVKWILEEIDVDVDDSGAGVYKSSHLNVRDLWARDSAGLEIFYSIMSYNRFLFWMLCIRFDNVLTHKDSLQTDKLAAIRKNYKEFNDSIRISYNVGLYIFIVENNLTGPHKTDFRPSEVVKRITKHLQGASRNITTDNWYTSYPLSTEILAKKTMLVDTKKK
ncbi:hypothetical protein J437_LFUL016198 [Ladona fulva]|uniref:PiggyBac transposable element-derived protein domain-containing protein n=1 Tax=Ladona fulva TaxID=123851 RepID=A0A8K0KKW7_LADFU|nr:hypothetical protein J437_LFUL016198 [Ladona fulva]